jgi:hypothetical protein
MVSAKAEKLLAVIQAKGGGILDEYLLRDKTGLSHGSIVAGRKELEMAGLLTLTKQGRKLYYTLTGQENAPLTGQVPVDGQPAVNCQPLAGSQQSADGQSPAGQTMPANRQESMVNPASTVNPAGGDFSPASPVTPAPAAEVPADTSPPADNAAAPPSSDASAAFLPAMPHIAGTFYDFDEWTDALMNALGACIYISESLTGDGTYTVYSHEYEGEDTYLTETTEDGFIVQ